MTAADTTQPVKVRKARPLTADLQIVIERERLECSQEAKRSLRFYWNRGRIADALRCKVPVCGAASANYGPNPLETMADALKIDRSQVYKQLNFFLLVPRYTDLERLAERAFAANITWGHVAACMTAPLAKGEDPHINRRKLLEDAISNRWTVNDINTESMRRFPAARKLGDRRTGPMMALKLLAKADVQFQTRYGERWQLATAAISSFPADDMTPARLVLLEKSYSSLNNVMDISSRMAEQLRTEIERVKRALPSD